MLSPTQRRGKRISGLLVRSRAARQGHGRLLWQDRDTNAEPSATRPDATSCRTGGYADQFLDCDGDRPRSRGDWLLENLLVVIGGLLFWRLYRKPGLSTLSCVAVAVFFAFHIYGAHYTYSEAPFGFWLRDIGDTVRNPYDRLVHFLFGLLMSWPVREAICHAAAKARHRWVCMSTVMWIAAISTYYELMEWAAMLVVAPELGIAFMGTQGDVFDAHKDSALAVFGAMLSMGLAWVAGPRFARFPLPAGKDLSGQI
jgi:putative membrane protein